MFHSHQNSVTNQNGGFKGMNGPVGETPHPKPHRWEVVYSEPNKLSGAGGGPF